MICKLTLHHLFHAPLIHPIFRNSMFDIYSTVADVIIIIKPPADWGYQCLAAVGLIPVDYL